MTSGRSPVRLGLDFDNTVVVYDAVFRKLAAEAGLLPKGLVGGKRAVRDHIRTLPDGEALWTALQARVYGPCIGLAVPSPGLLDFLALCQEAEIELAIVSHKTRFAAANPGGVDLREAARAWIVAQGLIAPAEGGISAERIFFESTRAEKLARLRALHCTHFVDDLAEVFLEPDFPPLVRSYLYAPAEVAPPTGPWRVVRSWREIADDLFDRTLAA